MSQSDRLLSLSLDDIIKLRRSRRGNSQAPSTARNRGQQRRGSIAQNRTGSTIRNQVQSRGQWNRRSRGTQRGQQRGIVRSNQRFQRSNYEQNYQRQGHQQSWSYQQILVSRGQRSRNWSQRGQSRLTTGVRGRGIMRQTIQPRVNQTQATQVARNRIRQAANILLQRRIQLQRLNMLNQRGGGRGSQTTRGRLGMARGRVRNAGIMARAAALQKINRAQRTRQEQQNRMLSVSIENERALESESFSLPQMVVFNQPVERTFPAPLPQRSLVLPLARNRVQIPLQTEEEVPVPFVSSSGRRLTLHERFSHF